MNEMFFAADTSQEYSPRDVYQYLKTYTNHHTKVIKSKTFDIDGMFATEHTYENGLILRVFWNTKAATIEAVFSDIHQLFMLMDREIIHMVDCEVVQLPSSAQPPQSGARKQTSEKTAIVKGLLDDEEYKQLEFALSVPLTYPDSQYDALIATIANQLAFEDFYQRRQHTNHSL